MAIAILDKFKIGAAGKGFWYMRHILAFYVLNLLAKVLKIRCLIDQMWKAYVFYSYCTWTLPQ